MKTTLSQRLRIVLGGGALVVVTGFVVAWDLLPGLFAESGPIRPLVIAAVVLAPLFLIPAGIASLSTGSATAFLLIAGGVATVLAFPVYPILRPRSAGWVSVIGLLAWIACQLYVALAAQAL